MAPTKAAVKSLESLEPAGQYGVTVIAALFGKTPRRIAQLAAEGIIPRPSRGRYALAATFSAYIAHLEGQARAAGARGGQPHKGSEAATARARLDNAKADLAELEHSEAHGALLPREQVIKTWGQVVSAARNRVLNVTARMIQRAKIDARTRKILREELDRALFDLSAGNGIELSQPDKQG